MTYDDNDLVNSGTNLALGSTLTAAPGLRGRATNDHRGLRVCTVYRPHNEHLYSPRAEVTTIQYNTVSLKTKSKIQT